MKKVNKKVIIISSILTSLFLCVPLFSSLNNKTITHEMKNNKRELPHELSAMNYTSYSNSKDGIAANDKNALNGQKIQLGPDTCVRTFESGVSLITFSTTEVAYIDLILPETHEYAMFESNVGVDYASKSSGATIKVNVILDGKNVKSVTSKANSFQSKICVDVTKIRTFRLEVIGAEGTCVSFGDAMFYVNSNNAVSKVIENETLSGWPAPVQRNYNLYGGNLKIGTESYDYGFCANSTASFDLLVNGNYNYFEASVGIDEAVAGGANAGSSVVTASVYDKDNNLLSKVTSPVLYGYQEPYKLIADVKNAYKINFKISDGGDGIANDMTVIGNPMFMESFDSGKIYLSDMPIAASNVGWGKLGIDKTTEGNALNYQIYGTKLSYNKGLGLHLVDVPYTTYINDKNNYLNFSYAKVDISNLKADFFETLVMDPASNGAYYEIYIDNNLVYESGLVKGFTTSSNPYPKRVSVAIPENAKEFEFRVIADTTYNNGRIDLVNAAFYKSNGSLSYARILEEEVSQTNPFPVNRQTAFDGSYAKMIVGTEEQYFYNSFTSSANSSYILDASKYVGDTFTAKVGLSTLTPDANLKFEVEVVNKDNSVSKATTPYLNKDNSGYTITHYFGNDAKTIKLSIISEDSSVGAGVWGNINVYKTTLKDVELITDMTWSDSMSGWGSVGINKNVVGGPLIINGTNYENGICLHAPYDYKQNAFVEINFPKTYGYTVFESWIGVNKDTSNGGTAGSVIFIIEGDGVELYRSNLMRSSQDAEHILIDITGVSSLKLMVNNGDKSYDCDWADYINPKIAKSIDDLEPYLDLSSPIDGQSVVLSDNNSITIEGCSLGGEKTTNVYLNGELVDTPNIGALGKFTSTINLTQYGNNTIKVEANGIEKEVIIKVADELENAKEQVLSTNTIQATIKPAENGIMITSLINEEGYDWLNGGSSFVPFIDYVRLGGKNGTDMNLTWIYKDLKIKEETTVKKNINSLHEDYEGKTTYYTYTYEDSTRQFVIESIWWIEDNFDSPIQHKINLVNNSGQTIYVDTANSMTLDLYRQPGAKVTNSYTYKSAVYTTNYGYRCDVVEDGYEMNVFSTAEYNNGKQIDAGYIPWASITQQNATSQNGLYFGVVFPDCRVHVYGKGQQIYVKAGLDDTFYTEIPNNETYKIPTTFIGAYVGDVDDGSIQMKDWYFTFMMQECNRVDDKLPTFGYNFWEVLDSERRSWRMTDDKFYDAANEMYIAGLDEITIDTYWWKNVGDWRGAHENWDTTMEYTANFIQALDMYLTIYMQAGNGLSDHSDALTSNGVHGNPNWFARGESLSWDEVCIADPDAREYLEDYLMNYFMEFGLNGIRTDFGWVIGYCEKEGHEHIDERTDVGYWTSVEMAEIMETMYELFPMPTDVNEGSEVNYFRWENCNCGGTLKDFMSMSYATRIQTTDAYSTSEVRRSFYDSSYCYPSMQLMLWLNDYMYDWTGPIDDDQYRFYSILAGSPCPMMSMLSDMSDETYAEFVRTVEIYNEWFKDLVKYGDVYHNMDRYDGVNWDGIQYYDDLTKKGAVVAFKPDPDGTVDDTYCVPFKGLDDKATYYVWSENNKIPFATYTGEQLRKGINLTLEGSYKAEVIYFMDTTAVDAEEVIRIPSQVSALVIENLGNVTLTIDNSELAEIYEVKILDENEDVVHSFETNDVSESFVINGLKSGKYNLQIKTINKFGSALSTQEFNVGETSKFVTSNYNVTGDYSIENIVLDGQQYISGYEVDLSDVVFNENASKTLTISNLQSDTYKARFGLPIIDEDVSVNAKLYAVIDSKQELVESYDLNKDNSILDLNVKLPEGTSSLKLVLTNTSKDVYYQTNTGYGRVGLLNQKGYSDYEFNVDVDVIRNGLNETFPRAGVYSAYVSEDNFHAIYIDSYYSNIVIYERTNGKSSDNVLKYKMPEGFDYKAKHNIKVVKESNTIVYYIDGQHIASRSISKTAYRVGMITEDAVARFGNISLIVDGETKETNWVQRNCLVEINGKTLYSTTYKEGIWHRIKPTFIIIM